jgi:L-amino acid N-acyltransferase YncA
MKSNYEIDDKPAMQADTLSSVSFKLAKDDDLPYIKQIWINGLKQVNPLLQLTDVHTALFDSSFKNRKGLYNFWVAEKPHVIGWCSILPAFSHPLKQENNGEVSIYLDTMVTDKGIGTSLMKLVFKQLEASNISAVYGFTHPLNLPSIKMLENAGMVICGQTSTRVILIKEYI